jgi:hypothetical protein
MNKSMQTIILTILVLVLPLHVVAGPVEDRLMGKVHLRANMKLDPQARKEIAAAATKIKKSRVGAVKIRGHYAVASTPEEYLSKSVFMARTVEQHLKTLLPPRQQIYIVTSQYTPERKGEQYEVEIFLYPHELKADDVKVFKSNTLESREPVAQPVEATPVAPTSADQVREPAAPEGVRAPAAQPVVDQEDAARANELVNRAKERAAERAKRRKDAE